MTALLHAGGFLGTRANWAADVTLLAMILMAVLFSVGFYLARRGKYTAHRWVQTSAATLNAVFVLWLMILPFRDFVICDQGGPREGIFYLITALHAVLGLTSFLFGVFIVLRANGLMIKPLRFNNYKLFMRISYTLYIAAALAGIVVYLAWFVLIPAEQVPVYEGEAWLRVLGLL